MSTAVHDLRSLIRPVRRTMLSSAIWAAGGAVAGVLGLVAVAGILGELLAPEPGGSRITILILLAATGATLRFLMRWWSIRLSHLAGYDFETEVRGRLVTHLARLPLGEVDRLGAGPLKKIVLDDVRELHAAVSDIPPNLGFAVAGPVAATAVLLLADWRLALASLSLAPGAWLALRFGFRDPPEARAAYDRANEAINGAVVELVQGMPVVRMFDDGSIATDRFRRRVDDFTEALSNRNYTGRRATMLTALFVVPLPTMLVILLVGAGLLQADSLSRSDLLIFLVLGVVPIETVRPLAWLVEFVRESAAGAQQIADVMRLTPLPEPATPAAPADGSVRVRGVRFSYGHQRPGWALDGVDLDIPAGTVCALVGSSGAGKTTLARLVARSYDVAEGSIEIGGVDVREIGSELLLRRIAIVFQEPFLTHDTVRNNIRMGRPDANDSDVEHVAKAAQAHDFILADLACGYDTVVGERGSQLSGGQRQRITIARALLNDPALVILDEATAFADPENEAAIRAGLAQLCQGRTVLTVAHRLRTVVDADQIAVLEAGRVVEHGTHEDLLMARGRYAELWAQQVTAEAWGLGATR